MEKVCKIELITLDEHGKRDTSKSCTAIFPVHLANRFATAKFLESFLRYAEDPLSNDATDELYNPDTFRMIKKVAGDLHNRTIALTGLKELKEDGKTRLVIDYRENK